MCVDRQRSAKLVAVARKWHELLTLAWSYAIRMLFVVCDAFNVLSCSHCFQPILLPVLSFVKNFADPVTVHVRLHINFTELNFHLITLCSQFRLYIQ